jgi:tyrosyl-tRNA synthetase
MRSSPETPTNAALRSPGAAPPSVADPAARAAWLSRNAVDSLPRGALIEKLSLGRPLRVKLGIDPTAPDIHLGFTVVLQKLREFQELGHTVVLIVGDYTARVGDPSGRSVTRPVLSPEEIEANAATFHEQAMKILSPDRLEVRHNSEWLDMAMPELFRLMSSATVAQVIERDDFAKRLREGSPISMLELLYPLLMGYDSVAVQADVELGGGDQKFNLLMGREIQRAYGQPEQTILTVPLLTGTDGEKKMSKSVGNYIGVAEPPGEIYGKTLSIPDTSLPLWYSLLLGSKPAPDLPPRDQKRALAFALVRRFHDEAAAVRAEQEFDRVHIQRGVPDSVPEVRFDTGTVDGHKGHVPGSGRGPDGGGGAVHLPALIGVAFGISTSDARRTLVQGGVKLDGEPVDPARLDLRPDEVDGRLLQVGKRRFARIRLNG